MAERITGHTELIGLMAYPIRHSSSPAMQNEAFAKLGYDYAYLAFEVGADEIEDAVKAIRTLKMRGSNVSMPNKTLVGKYLDELSPAAELCGAVNTIVNDNGHLTGHITDGIGFMSALKDNDIDVIGKKMTIVGAGGAATAIEIQAALDGVAEITIFNRKDEFWDRAVSTVEKINTRTSSHAVLYDLAELDKLKEEMNDSYLFVNATGVGMKPLEGQSVVPDKSYFRPELIVLYENRFYRYADVGISYFISIIFCIVILLVFRYRYDLERDKVASYLAGASGEGATVVVDGREADLPSDGFFLGVSLVDQVKPGMKVLFVAFGGGLTWGSSLWQL